MRSKSPFLANKTIALIEAGDLMRTPALESGTFANRASSITPGSARFLQGLGVWDAIEPKQAYTRMVVWDSESDGRVDFDAYSHGAGAAAMPEGHGPAIAWMVQNHLIQHQLAECVARTPSIVLFNESKVHSIVRSESSGLPVVSLDRGEPIECQLLVGADGLHSKVREYAGIESIGWDYDQHGIVATLAVEDDGTGNDTAWQRFLPTGPIALLPDVQQLAPGYSSLVWSTKPAIAAKLTKAAPEVFVELVNAAFHNPVADIDFLGSQVQADGSIADGVDIAGEASWGRERARGQDSGERMPPRVVGVQPKSRAPFPLRLRNSTSYVYERTALIG
nr:putative ubiquinone biosynthesis monooxygenase [Polyrhizophydium stewartii]